MKLLLDENLSPALLIVLRALSVACTHVAREGLLSADDREIWAFAVREGYTIVTKDRDFHQLALVKGAPPQVVRLAIGNQSLATTQRILCAHLELIRAFVTAADRAVLVILDGDEATPI
jgi:predicted nuclease of predicted toxin-antitoxin system